MKKLISLFLAAAMLLGLPAGALASGSGDLVTEAFCYDFYAGDGDSWEYHVPQVEGSGAGIEALNAAIWHDLYDGYIGALTYAGSDYWPNTTGMSYYWAANGDILSIWVVVYGMTDNNEYYVYNMSLSTGERISDAELFKAAGVTREEFNDLLQTELSNRMDSYSYMDDGGYIEEMRGEALSARNLGLAMPYMGLGGSLCAVAWVYVPAGAGRYLETLTLLPGESDGRVAWFIEHSDSQYLTENDLQGFTEEMCNYARNGVYARSGRKFQSAELQEYFMQFDWYTPAIDPADFSGDMLNSYQNHNIALVMDYEAAHGW